MNPSSEPDDPRLSAMVGGCLYSVLLFSGLGWLWARDRLEILPELAIGRHGVVLAAAAGLAVGLVGSLVTSILSRRLLFVREVEGKAHGMLAPMAEGPLLALVVGGALAEEIFFRLAVQDAFGLPGSVACYTLLNSTTAGWRWLPIAALHATVLGLLMQSGFGLLGTTAANAVMNHLTLRRILSK
jgi:membrane protease YdiL (CAAX protease family)